MDGGPGKAQSLEMYSDTLKPVKSQRHLCRSKCDYFELWGSFNKIV